MSRNFELLAQIEHELGSAVPDRTSNAVRSSTSDLASLTHAAAEVETEVDRLVERIFFPHTGVPSRHALFFGIEANNASSSIGAQVARTLAAKSGERVCLIDAHPASGGVSDVFGVPPYPEEGRTGSMIDACVPVAANLWLVRWPSASARRDLPPIFRSRFAELQHDFRYCLIDAPGCHLNDDAMVWAHVSDAAILVIEAETTRRVDVRKAKQTLETAGVRLAGTVLHNRSFPVPKALYDRL